MSGCPLSTREVASALGSAIHHNRQQNAKNSCHWPTTPICWSYLMCISPDCVRASNLLSTPHLDTYSPGSCSGRIHFVKKSSFFCIFCLTRIHRTLYYTWPREISGRAKVNGFYYPNLKFNSNLLKRHFDADKEEEDIIVFFSFDRH